MSQEESTHETVTVSTTSESTPDTSSHSNTSNSSSSSGSSKKKTTMKSGVSQELPKEPEIKLTTPKKISVTTCQNTCLTSFLPSKVANILTWKSPIVSMMVLSGLLVTIYVLFFSRWKLVSLMAYGFLTAIIVNFIYVTIIMVMASVQNQDVVNPNKEALRNKKLQLPKESTLVYAGKCIDGANGVLAQVASILFIESRNKTIKCCIGLYIVGSIANWISFPTLVTLLVVFSFSIPKLYDVFHTHIHSYMDLASRQFDMILKRSTTFVKNLISTNQASLKKKFQ